MARKTVGYNASRSIPYIHATIEIYPLVNHELQISDHRPAAIFPQLRENLGLQVIEPLYKRKVPKELARREQVTPAGHAILDWTRIIALWKTFSRNKPRRFPRRPLLLQPSFGLFQRLQITVVRRAEKSDFSCLDFPSPRAAGVVLGLAVPVEQRL